MARSLVHRSTVEEPPDFHARIVPGAEIYHAGEGTMNISELPATDSPSGKSTVDTEAGDLKEKVVELCATCGHRQADHDALGIRFCAATMNSSLSRGCICKR